MQGTILDAIDGGTVWLLVIGIDGRVAEQPIEPRYMADIVQAEGFESPRDLVGREIALSEDGTPIGLP